MLQHQRTATWRSDIYQAVGMPPCPPAAGVSLQHLGRFFSSGQFVFEQVAAAVSVHVVAAGQGVMRADGVPYPVGAGDVFAFFPGRHYYYFDQPQTPWRYTWFCLCGPQATAALALAGLTPAQPWRAGDFATRLEPLFRETEAMFQRTATPPTFPPAMAWRLIDALAEPAAPVSPCLAEMARALMEHHFTMMLSVEEIAARLNVSRSTLFRAFRARYGVSPKQFLDGVRVARAQQLLRHSHSSIKEIAAACGFHDGHYFSRAYRHACGYPPSEERRDAIPSPLRAR